MEKFELWWNTVIGEEKPKGLYDIILGDLIKKFALKAWQECASQIKESPAIPQQPNRGFICVDSISQHKFSDIENALKTTLENWKRKAVAEKRYSQWLADYCVFLHSGSNGSAWIFIASEHKDYDESMRTLIQAVVDTFPNCEGRTEKQYEEVKLGELGEEDTEYIIAGGVITERQYTPHQYGYGLETTIKIGAKEPVNDVQQAKPITQ